MSSPIGVQGHGQSETTSGMFAESAKREARKDTPEPPKAYVSDPMAQPAALPGPPLPLPRLSPRAFLT